MPCGQIRMDVRLCVGFTVVSGIRVQRHLFLRIREKVRWRALGRCVLKRVLEPMVVCAGGGGVHMECDFVSEWLGGHRFE